MAEKTPRSDFRDAWESGAPDGPELERAFATSLSNVSKARIDVAGIEPGMHAPDPVWDTGNRSIHATKRAGPHGAVIARGRFRRMGADRCPEGELADAQRQLVQSREETMQKATIRNLLMISTLTLVLPVSTALAQDSPLPAGFKTQPLIKTTVNRDNGPIVYPTGKPEIVSVIGTLDKGGQTALHEHPVPVYVYVLEGEIEVRSEGGAPQRYKAGEAFVESQNRKHQAFNVTDAPSKALIIFIGEEGKPTTTAAQ